MDATLQSVDDPKLVIIDPVFRFIRVKDGNDYIQVGDALEPLLTVARKYGVHILTVHHMKKRESDDATDAALGSTAITAAVDTYITLKRSGNGSRVIATQQRYGYDLPPTHLNWNPEQRGLSLGVSCEEADRQEAQATRKRVEEKMIGYVSVQGGCTQDAIMTAVQGKTTTKKQVLQHLIDQGMFVQSGTGVKGDPYTYRFREIEMATSVHRTV